MWAPEQPGKERAAALTAATWPAGTSIGISFLDGIPSVQDRVKTAAMQWLTRTGIHLDFNWLNDPEAGTIRISFSRKGSWSVLGKYAEQVPKGEPTMNFGWLNKHSSDLAVREVVLHEFGHALGLIHEHQNPDGGIQWNEEKVIESLSGPPNNWSEEKIRRNVLDHYTAHKIHGTPFDMNSIMLYPFPAEWTTNTNGTRNNTDLSDMDISLVQELYQSN